MVSVELKSAPPSGHVLLQGMSRSLTVPVREQGLKGHRLRLKQLQEINRREESSLSPIRGPSLWLAAVGFGTRGCHLDPLPPWALLPSVFSDGLCSWRGHLWPAALSRTEPPASILTDAFAAKLPGETPRKSSDWPVWVSSCEAVIDNKD